CSRRLSDSGNATLPPLPTLRFIVLLLPLPPSPTLFPYTTLFRSVELLPRHAVFAALVAAVRDGDAQVADTMAEGILHGRQRSRRSEEHTSELQSRENLVCRLLLEKKKPQDFAAQVGSRTGAPLAA